MDSNKSVHGRVHEPRQPRLSHRLKTSKGKGAKRGRGGGGAAGKVEDMRGESAEGVSVRRSALAVPSVSTCNKRLTVCARRASWQERTYPCVVKIVDPAIAEESEVFAS